MAECKFEVGDVVTIRDWSDMAHEYGVNEITGSIEIPLVFLTDMRYLCGQTSVIKRIVPADIHNTYLITLERNERGFFGDEYKWKFSQEMLRFAGWSIKFPEDEYLAVLDAAI